MSEALLLQCAGLFLLAFTAIAGLDGLYLHLFKYKLYKQPESLFEHKLHTLNAILFPFTVFCLFTPWGVGWVLWVGVALTLVTFGIELRDVWCEPASRSKAGGLTGFESFLHFAMGLLRCAYSCFIFASRPNLAWMFDARPFQAEEKVGVLSVPVDLHLPVWLQVAALMIVISGFGVALLHIILMQRGQKDVAQKLNLQRA